MSIINFLIIVIGVSLNAAGQLFLKSGANIIGPITTNSNIATTLTYASGTATGDGSDTTFTINSGRSVNDVLVIVNGAILIPTTDYTISGTTLTFITAPAAAAEIQIRYLPLST